MTPKSIAHKYDMNLVGQASFPTGLVPWRNAAPPNLRKLLTTGRLRACDYCGSMHPSDVVAAIQAGATGGWADWKYGWPHKYYLDSVPNPHAGLLEGRSSQNFPPPNTDQTVWQKIKGWWYEIAPAAPTTSGKFYTVHLQDATPQERAIIEQFMGLTFEFLEDGRRVRWHRVERDQSAIEGQA